jgi:hypothetical protein
MLFLPLPDPLGVLLVAEIFFVSRFGQPVALISPLPGLLTFDLGTKALSIPMPVIRKKKSLAVRAFTALLGLHRFENQTDQSEEHSAEEGRKSRRKKTQNGEEGRRLFSESSKKTPTKKIHF